MHDELMAILPGLRRFAFSLTGSMSDADDLLQNTVERLLSRERPADADLLKWAFRVCRNLWIDECRARKVRQQAATQPELAEGQWVDGERAARSQREWFQVDAAMATLTEDQRQLIALVAMQGMSYDEVAEILAVPKGTVMSRLARARAALAGALGKAGVRS